MSEWCASIHTIYSNSFRWTERWMRTMMRTHHLMQEKSTWLRTNARTHCSVHIDNVPSPSDSPPWPPLHAPLKASKTWARPTVLCAELSARHTPRQVSHWLSVVRERVNVSCACFTCVSSKRAAIFTYSGAREIRILEYIYTYILTTKPHTQTQRYISNFIRFVSPNKNLPIHRAIFIGLDGNTGSPTFQQSKNRCGPQFPAVRQCVAFAPITPNRPPPPNKRVHARAFRAVFRIVVGGRIEWMVVLVVWSVMGVTVKNFGVCVCVCVCNEGKAWRVFGDKSGGVFAVCLRRFE